MTGVQGSKPSSFFRFLLRSLYPSSIASLVLWSAVILALVAKAADAQGIRDHSADQSGSRMIELSELLRVIQFFNSEGYHCAEPPSSTEDGYLPDANVGARQCAPHDSDYAPQDWEISLSELLRLIQFFNAGAYHVACDTEDGFAPGAGEDCASEGEGEGEGEAPPTLQEAAEILWTHFASLDTDGSGSITYQQALQAVPSLRQSQFLQLSNHRTNLSQFTLADYLGEPEPFVETNMIDPEEIAWAAFRNMTASSLDTLNNQQRAS